MRCRDYYLKREATIKDSDTVTIDLSAIKTPISYISIEYEATNGTTSCVDHELHDDVSKIELVDGSDVLASLSMIGWQALNFFELKRFPHMKLTEAGGAVQEEKVYIFFGRYPDDPLFYFDATKFASPILQCTHKLTIDASAGFQTGTGKITVMARLIEEGAEPYRGFLMAKERKTFISAASGDDETDLYRDYAYRMILVQALLSTNQPHEIISKAKLSIDADKYVPFDMYTEDIYDKNLADYGLVKQIKTLFTAHDGTALLDVYNIKSARLRPDVANHLGYISAVDAEKVTNELYDLSSPATPATQTTPKNCEVEVDGLSPHAMIALPLPIDLKAEEWFDPTDYGSVKLFLTQAMANATVKIITQQLRT